MRRAALLLVPLFLFACDREPTGPTSGVDPTFSASSEWTEYTYPYPVEGWNWGPVECLPGSPDAIAFGTVIIREHIVTTPKGRMVDRFWNPGWSEDHYLLIEGDVWALDKMVRHGILMFEGDVMVQVHQSNPLFRYTNQRTGAQLDWTMNGQLRFDEQGQPLFERWWGQCRVVTP
jgi:hypothetical protein